MIETGSVRLHRSRELHDRPNSRPNTPTAAADGPFGLEQSDGDRVHLQICRDGEIVGELALLYGEKRASSATVEVHGGPCVAWSLTRDRFRALAAVADARSLSTRAAVWKTTLS